MNERLWKIKEQPENQVAALSKALRVPSFVARLLINRGLSDPADALAFLRTDESAMHDPFLMRDMDRAVARISRAVRAGEKIVVYGDYDADGITATCVLLLYLRAAGGNADFYIPDRAGEGYGVHADALKSIRAGGAGLVITVDTGITAAEELSQAAGMGLDAVVTDHHECKETLPECCAVLNPRRPDCPYPFKELAGVGVVYKLIRALDTVLHVECYPENNIRCLAAIGTVADIMPLVLENRTLVRMGLRDMNLQISNLGIRALALASGVDPAGRVTASTIGFILAPRINAAGRIGSARTAVELFLSDNLNDAARLAAQLCENNRCRQKMENDIFDEAIEALGTEYDPASDNSIVLCRKGWHQGVIGIVASRLVERYHVPCILLTEEDGEVRGSGRSVRGVNLFQALGRCAPYLTRFGGHEMALGLALPLSALSDFKRQLNGAIAEQGPPEPPMLDVDCLLSPEELTLEAAHAVEALEPYGAGNPAPCFALRDGSVVSLVPLSGDKHSKLVVKAGRSCFTGLFFGTPLSKLSCAEGDCVDLAFSLEADCFRGEESLRLIVRDIKTQCLIDTGALESAYRRACGGDTSGALAHTPSREDLAAVYRYFKRRQSSGVISHNRLALPRSIESLSGRPMDLCKLLLSLDILCELGIFAVEETGDILIVRRGNESGRVELSDSPLWRTLTSCH